MYLELLSQGIHKVHRDLVGLSPGAQKTVLQDDGASWLWTSPVTEKLKRRRTTMEEFGSSSGLGMGKNKVLKTYGSQKTRDDKTLRDGAVEISWANGSPDAASTGFNDNVSALTQENKKRRVTVAPNDLLSANEMPGKKRLKRRITTAGAITETDFRYDDEQHQEPYLRSVRDSTDIGVTALKPSAFVSGEYLEHLTLPLMENSMRPPLSKHELEQQTMLMTSVSSTIPGTPIEAGRSQKLPSTDKTESPDRMPSPTTSGKSSKEILSQSMEHVDDALNYLAEVDMVDSATHITHPPAPEESSKDKKNTIPSILPSTQGSASGTQDELSIITPKDKDPTTVQEKKSTPKSSEINNMNELGSDEVAIGLPTERYQPRPSRSRTNRTVDDLVLAIDYSKRPEAVVKARNKRRKTDGDQLAATKKETVDMDLSGKKEEIYDADMEFLPQRDHDGDSRLTKAAMADASIEEVDIVASAVDPEPLKKKRGRPKKQTTTDNDDRAVQKVTKLVTDETADADVLSTTTAISTGKKSRKRKKTQETVDLSEEIVIEEDESTSACQTIAQEQIHADDCNASLDTSQNSANIIKASVQLNETPMYMNEETVHETMKSNPPPETPKKPVAKGPGKHSPLNTGKVPYRVGLSKRARIEPLLRVVRK